jgi:methanethiol S-methyltransferase
MASGWLQARYPGMDLMSHDTGHPWSTIFGLKGNPHLSLLHILSCVFIGGGFVLLAESWDVLYQAQKQQRLEVRSAYAHVRHPQYVAFIAIMFGFLLQWPTILTLAMFPVLVVMYVHLAHTEEAEVRRTFGAEYDRYAAEVPAWFPRLRGLAPADRPGVG